MARSKGMTEDELTVLCDGWVQDARSSDDELYRRKATDFYEGRIDVDDEPNKSRVVSPDLANVLEWIHPGLLRVFVGGEKVVEYKPNTEADVKMAKQATAGINYEFLRGADIGGYSVLSAALHDALLMGNGVIKHWWEAAKQYKTETMTGLTEDEYYALLDDETVEEVLEKREYMVDPMSGEEIEPDGEPLKIDDEEENVPQDDTPAETY